MGVLLSEHEEQVMLFQWWKYFSKNTGVMMYAVPNGGTRHPIEARNLKAEGVLKGVPDIFLAHARLGYHGMYIEMKRKKKFCVSEEQKDMMRTLRRAGYYVTLCCGFDEAKDEITKYLTGNGEDLKFKGAE